VEIKKIQIQDKNIAYKWVHENAGLAEDPIIIFLHEGLGSIAQWKKFPESLCKEVNLQGLVYDRPGYGQSDRVSYEWNANFLNIQAFEVLPQLISELLPERKYIIFGHSDGGTMALLHASLNNEKCLGVISECPHVIIEQASADGIEQTVEAYENTKLPGLLSRYHGDKTEELFHAWSGTWLSEEGHKWHMKEELSRTTTPILFVQGDRDHFGTMKQYEIIEQHVKGPVSALHLEDCGHSPHLEKEEIILIESAKFIYEAKS
jgi:pimeloyl-ACP methyl ester carboxylesterase